MNTAIRFVLDELTPKEISEFGKKFDEMSNGMFRGLNGQKNGFNLKISSDNDWSVHKEEIIKFISVFSGLIFQIKTLGGSIMIDVGVMPEDMENVTYYNSFSFGDRLIKALEANNVGLSMTIYKI